MVDKDLDSKSRLVARAREKAERCGTTLESELEAWLARYVNEPDNETSRTGEDTRETNWLKPRESFARAIDSIGKSGSSGRNTRSEAYRRLLGVINDPSKNPSKRTS